MVPHYQSKGGERSRSRHMPQLLSLCVCRECECAQNCITRTWASTTTTTDHCALRQQKLKLYKACYSMP